MTVFQIKRRRLLKQTASVEIEAQNASVAADMASDVIWREQNWKTNVEEMEEKIDVEPIIDGDEKLPLNMPLSRFIK